MKREPALRGASGHFAAVRSRKKRGCGGCVLLALLVALALAVYLVVARSEVHRPCAGGWRCSVREKR